MANFCELLKNLKQEDQDQIYLNLLQNNLQLMQKIIWANTAQNHSYILEKLKSNDKLTKLLLKDLMRVQEQKTGFQAFCKEVLKDKQNLIGIELGCFCGSSTQILHDTNCFKKLYCIDNFRWECSNVAEQIFDERFTNNNKIIKVKKNTFDAVNDFKYNSIDFIYIDADHSYESVKQDILNYYPKIKNGGIVAGHDYIEGWEGVIRAVNEIFGEPIKVFEDWSWYIIK